MPLSKRKPLTIGLLLCVFVGVIAGTAVGCGDSSEATTPPLTKAQFVKKANAVCERERGEAVSKSAADPNDINGSVLPSIRASIVALESLGAPKGDEEEIEALTSAMQEGVDGAEQAPSTSITKFEAFFEKSGDMARKYGVDACAFG